MNDTLEQRIHRLESIEAIRNLKSCYFAACDAKNPAGMRACFADGEVDIDFGAIGQFNRADDLVALYEQMALHPHIVEMHNGSNPRIEIIDSDNAEGQWALCYQVIDTEKMTLTQLGGDYQDRFRRTDSGWKIVASQFVVHSTLVLELGEDQLKKLFAGRRMPMPGAA